MQRFYFEQVKKSHLNYYVHIYNTTIQYSYQNISNITIKCKFIIQVDCSWVNCLKNNDIKNIHGLVLSWFFSLASTTRLACDMWGLRWLKPRLHYNFLGTARQIQTVQARQPSRFLRKCRHSVCALRGRIHVEISARLLGDGKEGGNVLNKKHEVWNTESAL